MFKSGNNNVGISGVVIDPAKPGEQGILEKAQLAFPDGLWWIKDRANDNDHQLVDSVRGSTGVTTCPTLQVEQTYAAPTGSSVAWCWNAGGPAVANSDGAIPSQVAANQAAGFSIVSWTGDGNGDAGVGHGLTQAPEFMFYINRSEAQTIWVWTTYINGNNHYLQLNNNSSAGL